MNFRIKNVVVLGSGVMGSGIACHLANIGLKVMMLEILPKVKAHENNINRNSVAQEALNKAINAGYSRENQTMIKRYFNSLSQIQSTQGALENYNDE